MFCFPVPVTPRYRPLGSVESLAQVPPGCAGSARQENKRSVNRSASTPRRQRSPSAVRTPDRSARPHSPGHRTQLVGATPEVTALLGVVSAVLGLPVILFTPWIKQQLIANCGAFFTEA